MIAAVPGTLRQMFIITKEPACKKTTIKKPFYDTFLVPLLSNTISNTLRRLRTLTSYLSLAFLVFAREVIHCAGKTDAGLAVMTSLSCECQLSA